MRKWVIAGLVWALSACASSGRHHTLELASILASHEAHDMVPSEVQRFPTADLEPYMPKLLAIIEARNIRVHFVPSVTEALRASGMQNVPTSLTLWGYNLGGHIYISQWLSVDERFGTLVHELGHSLQPISLTGKTDSQVFAEALSVIVCRELGKDMLRASFPYLQDYPQRHIVLQRYSSHIDRLVAELLAELRK
jgi:hypothetical protein